MNPLRALNEHGQAAWLDYIKRDMLENGELEELVRRDGISGVTSNPAIFELAIGGSAAYDRQISDLLGGNPGIEVEALYEELAIRDIRAAADVLRPVYDTTGGADGFVSLEVSPHLAYQTEATIAAARGLWERVGRPNLMIKVPATDEGIPAIEELIAIGINVNVTLMFSLADYEAVSHAYLRGVERNPSPSDVASVASFFVSRVDTKVDAALGEIASADALALQGTIAIANSKLAYRRFEELFHGSAFESARSRGARVQRVLWASTSAKNPNYRDVVYVEELIGPETVNTIPPATIEAFRDHGVVEPTLLRGVDEAARRVAALDTLGVDLAALTLDLKREGVDAFVRPFDKLLTTLEAKRQDLIGVGSRPV